MQRAGPGRGFGVSHQKVALELDFASCSFAGYTELTLTPHDRALRVIHLNCRQATIQRITVAGIATDYSYVDHLSSVSLSDANDIHLYPELKRKLYAAASDGAGGELSILVPSEVHIQPARTGETPLDAPTPGSASTGAELAPLVVRIEYVVRAPADAVTFVLPTLEAPHRVPHLYTAPSCPDWARCWVPCVDSLWERCTWELEFVVPKMLGRPNEATQQAAEAEEEESEVLVVCTGDLVEQVTHPFHSHKTIFYFSQAVPTSVHHVAFAAGPFVMHNLLEQQSGGRSGAVAADDVSAALQLLSFCLPGREEEQRCSVGTVRQAMDYYGREFGSFPFGSLKLVFVDEPPADCHTAATLLLCSSDLLHSRSVIEQALETRQALHHAVAFQWVGVNIIQRTWADTWLVNALSLYMASLFMRRLMGHNEYRFRLKKDMDRCCHWDVGQPPLYAQGAAEPPDESVLPFLNLKGPLVLHILDRRLCKAGASLGLGRIIPKVLLQAITGEMTGNTLTTSNFLRTCRKVSGVELRAFAEQWIYASGCPRFFVTAEFNRKKLIIEFTVRQESPAAQYAAAHPAEAVASNPVQLFEGQLTARIHEADGTPYEHVFDINAVNKRIEVPFNTKYKRVRRNTKRFQARQAAAVAAAEGDQDAAEAMNMLDLGFACSMWEDEKQRETWRVADWTEEDEKIMAVAPHEWIRMDADFEWIAEVYFHQPDYMWVAQLERDRDVAAQLASVHALAALGNPIASSMLTRTVLVPKYFYRVRMEAAGALAQCAVPEHDYIGLFHLLMLFRTRFCHEPPREVTEAIKDPFSVPCIPKANDFSDFADYFVERALIQSISRVRNARGRTLPQVKRFLVNLLRYNDNSTNKFTDDYHVAGLIEALASAFVPVDSRVFGGFVPASEDPDAKDDAELLHEARYEVERRRELDQLVPSYHNVVTLASLDFNVALTLANLQPVDLALYLAYTRQGSFAPVRNAAFNCLLLLRGLQHRVVTRYFFAVLRTDENRNVKRALARSMCEALAVSIAAGDFNSASLIDEGGQVDASKADTSQVEALLRPLRKAIGRSAGVREGFLSALLAPGIDTGARWALLKFAEILFKGAEEHDVPFQPKLSVRVRMPSISTAVSAPPTPVEAPAPVRIRIKAPTMEAAPPAPVPEVEVPAGPRVSFTAAAEPIPRASTKVVLKHSSKPKKAKPVDVAQSSGMSPSDLTVCRILIKELFDDRRTGKHSVLFRVPVDPVRDHVPNYFKVIEDPMDLTSMRDKLNAGMYKDRFEFKADFDLMIANAKKFTPQTAARVHRDAVALETAFTRRWAAVTKTIAQTEAKARGEGLRREERSASPVKAREKSSSREVPPPPPPAAVAESSAAGAAATPAPAAPKLKIKLKPKISLAARASPAPAPSPAPTPAPAPAPARPAYSSPKPPPAASPAPTPVSHSHAATLSSARHSPATPSHSSPAPAKSKKALETDPVGASSGVPVHERKCKALINMLKARPESQWFRVPVDRHMVPTYYEEIKRPMDLSTMEGKLASGSYSDMSEVAADVLLISANAHQFNPPTTDPVVQADKLERAFRKEWPSLFKLDEQDKRTISGVLSRIVKHPDSWIFREAVDPEALGLTTYWDVVRREDARDLKLISTKLKEGRYDTLEAVEADVRLMLSNAKRFNANNEEVLAFCTAFETLFKQELDATRASLTGSAKRKSGAGPSGSNKKAKAG